MSSKAVYTKIKAMMGYHLQKEDYVQLIQNKTIAGLIGQLKQKKGYEKILKDASLRLHRGALEQLLKMNIYQTLQTLQPYILKDKAFFHLPFLQYQHKMIKESLLLIPEHKEVWIEHIFEEFKDDFPIEIATLLQCENREDIKNCYKDTRYEQIVTDYCEHQDVFLFDQALQKQYDDEVIKILKKIPKNSQKKIKDYLGLKSDMEHMQIIYRCRTYYQYTKAQMKPLLHLFYHKLLPYRLEQLMDCDMKDFIPLCQKYGYESMGEHHLKQKLYEKSMHLLYMEDDPYLSYLCIVTLLQIEYENLCTIIEGIRYQKDSEFMQAQIIV